MRRNWRRSDALGLMASMSAMALAACSSSTDTTVTESGPVEEDTEDETEDSSEGSSAEGVLKYQIDTLIDSFDSRIANDGYSFSVLAQLMEGLYVKDMEGVPVLAMAESVEKSDDGLEYVFTLRDDAVWSDGSAVTADDFVYAWQCLATNNTDYSFFVQTACLINADDVVAGEKDAEDLGVAAIDDKTLMLTLSSPCAILENLMTFPVFLPIQREFAEAQGSAYATSPDTLLCNGAYVLTDYAPSANTIKAEKNTNYYDADQVSLAGVEWQVIQNPQTAALSFENGDLDVVTLSGDLIEQYQDDACFMTVGEGYMWYINANLLVDGLDNLNVRLALAKSFDKEAIVQSILKDGSLVADYFVPVDLADSPIDGKDYRDCAGTYENWAYDLEAAQQYWEAGLSELGVDSLEYELVVEDTETAQLVAQFLQSEWQTNLSGLTINLKVEPKKNRLQDMGDGNYQLGLTRWGPDYADPMTDLDVFITGSSTNYGQWSNDEYDAIIDSAKYGELALDVEARWDALVGAESMIADDCIIFPIYQQSLAMLQSASVDNIAYFSTGANYLFKFTTKS